jgi:hypothetical protein
MTRRDFVLSLISLTSALSWGVPASDGDLAQYHDELSCGRAQFRLTTWSVTDHSTGDTEIVSQTLQLTDTARGISDQLPLGSAFVQHKLVLGRQILANFATEWACIASSSGQHYLFILYTCRYLATDCPFAIGSEWGKIFDTTGRFVTGDRTGLSVRVLRRLGLVEAWQRMNLTGIGPYR